MSLCGLGPTCHEFASKDEIPLDVTFNQMSGAIGSLLLIWSGIEIAARDEVIRFYGFLPPKAHGIKAVLRTWESTVNEAQPAETLCSLLAATLRSQLEGPLDVRNGICHGLVGISAAVDDSPAQLRWEMNDQKHSISWEDLQTSLQWLSKIRFAFSMISNPALGRLGCRMVDTIENREWWRAEWGLLLPQLRPHVEMLSVSAISVEEVRVRMPPRF